MENNNNSVIKVDIVSGARVVDELMMSDVFVFVLLSWLVVASAFFNYGEGAAFTWGVLKLSLVGMFFMGARERMKYDRLWGTINMCFVFLFGVFGGVTDILGSFGMTINPVVIGITNVYLGGLMLVCVRAVRSNPWTFSLMWLCAAVGVLALGLAGLGICSGALTFIGQLLLGAVAVLGTWGLIVFIHGYSGIAMPLGNPVYKENEKGEN